MTTPRVEHLAEGVTLYLGDCREILPTLGKVDAVVTDPPYGINAARTRNSQKDGWRDYDAPGWDREKPPAELIGAIIAAGRHAVVWGGNYFTDVLPPSSKWLSWDKGQTDFSLADFELAWCSFAGAARRITVSRAVAMQDGKEHPTQKSLEVMTWCISQIPPPRDSDPRPLHGLRHHRRCCRQTRPQVHRHRDRAQVFRHRMPSHLRRTAQARHVHREAEADQTGF